MTPEQEAAIREQLERSSPLALGQQRALLTAYDEQAREIERLREENAALHRYESDRMGVLK